MTERLVENSSTPAVLFLVFNRPDTTARVFEVIRAARPARLYVAADGPREGRLQEHDAVEHVRRLATAVDWPCELKTLFRERNLGCKRAVSSAIGWFFENEPEGIVLEDDCLPHPDFFSYCGELLARYRNDERIGLIAGTSLCDLREESLCWDTEDYVFTRYPSIWGWASWQRVWRDYDVDIAAWDHHRDDVSALTPDPRLRKINSRLFDRVRAGQIDTWDYQVSFMLWTTSRLAIAPRFNLVENIGFGAGATHTTDPHAAMSARARIRHDRLSRPFRAPAALMPNVRYQRFVERLATRSRLARILQRLLAHASR